jgi:peptidase M1-like protein
MVTSPRTFLLWTAIAAIALSPAASADRPSADDEGRTVLIQRDLSGPERGSLIAPAGDFTFTANLDADEAAKFYALRLAGEEPASRWHIEINDRAFEQDPLRTPEGQWYQIPPMLLRVGENTFVISAPEGEALGVTELEGISLESSAEESHFARFVSLPGVLVQPPTDPLQDRMDVLHCDLVITLDMSSTDIPSAALTMTAENIGPGSLSQCVLDFDDNGGLMAVSSVDDGAGSPLTHTHSGAEDRIFINLPAPVAVGNTFTVRVFYSGTPNIAGHFGAPYRRSTHSGVPVIYTFSEPYGARFWWPCKDVPEDKFTIDLHVTCPDASYSGHPLSVASNGDLVSVADNGSTLTFNWSEGHPLSTYLVSICCTNYQQASGTYTALDAMTTMEVAHHLYPEYYASESPELPRTIEVMEFFAQTFGEYPFLDEKYWTASHSSGSGMEHQTCTSMPYGNLATAYHRRNIHELSHSWFGDLITCENFDHLWIQEGWATYCEALFHEHRWGVADYHSFVDAWSTSDSYPIVSSQADNFNNGIVYRKGAWVLHMLRHVIGDADFFLAASNYIADPSLRYGTAVTDDLQAHYEAVTGQDLSWYFDQWLYRASRPSYEWSWNWHTEGSDAVIDLMIEQTQSDDVYIMPIDFQVNLSGGGSQVITVDNTQRLQAFAVNVGTGTPLSLTFDPDNWLLETHTEVSPPYSPRVIGDGATGTAAIHWTPQGGGGGYRLYQSADGLTGWTMVQDESTLLPSVTSTTVGGLATYTDAYFRLTELDTALPPNESIPSDVLGVRIGTGLAPLLIVDGYDRWDGQTAVNPTGVNHDFVADHGRAVSAYGTPFDSCANEALGNAVNLTDYEIVIWICGDESTVDETFSALEQDLVEVFLEGGGKLFVSGNEIGWDLDHSGSTADQAFYHIYLRANYVDDDSGDYSVVGTGTGLPVDSAFGLNAFNYGNGGDSPYLPGYPDLISPNSSEAALEYSTGNVAGIQYAGTFGSSAQPGMLICLGFAFETVYPEAYRVQMMEDVLTWFGASMPAGLMILGID